MIVTTLENLSEQLAMNPKFQKGIEYLKSGTWHGQPVGRVDIDGDNVYALIQSYETKVPQANIPFEGHRKYIDIQFIAEGKETLYWMPASQLTPTVAYDDPKDIWFSHVPAGDSTPVVLSPGQLAVFFPMDAHAPSHVAGAPTKVFKVLIKIAV